MKLFLKRLLQIMTIWQLVAPVADCQTGFNKKVEIPNTLSLNFDDILYDKHHLIVRGNAYIDSLNLWGIFIAALDTNGVVLWHNTIVDSSRHSHIISNTPSRIIKSTNDSYLLPSKFFNYGKSCLFILDLNGKEKYLQIYPKYELTIFPKDVIQLDNAYYITGSLQRENFKDDVFIMKTDSIGHQLWIKYYGTPSYNETFGDIIKNLDGTFSISSSTYSDDYYDEPFGHGWRRPWIFTVDTTGQVVKQWMGEKNDSRTLGGGPFYKTNNGDWIIVSTEYKDVLSAGQLDRNAAPTVSRMDSAYNLQWKIYLSDYVGMFDELLDLEYDLVRDEFVLTGQKTVYFNQWSGALEGWICKMSSQGEVLWSVTDTAVYDPNHYVQHHLGGVTLSPSGSIYAAGYIDHGIPPGPNYGWIIKATPDGCIDTICTTVSITDQINEKKKLITLYPNPISDQIHIKVQALRGNTTIHFYDLEGREVFKSAIYVGENNFSIDLPSGIYFYSVVDNLGCIASGKIVIE